MDPNADAPNSVHQVEAASTSASGTSEVRPGVVNRTESSLPPNLRPSVIDVPVTPGITREAYEVELSNKSEGAAGTERFEEGYFSRHDVEHALAASPIPGSTNREGQSFLNKIATGAQEGTDYLRRVSVAAMGESGPNPPSSGSSVPQASMSDIRAISPDLALTGNIISATFNIPHSLTYRKGADWVCACCVYSLVNPPIPHSSHAISRSFIAASSPPLPPPQCAVQWADRN
jgi:trehalose 6-phosphate synthase/phosphatase